MLSSTTLALSEAGPTVIARMDRSFITPTPNANMLTTDSRILDPSTRFERGFRQQIDGDRHEEGGLESDLSVRDALNCRSKHYTTGP
jgi:hypothetical protein